MKAVSTGLLEVYPTVLLFPFKPNMLISCSLRLTNKTEDCISFSLGTESSKYLAEMPLCGVVPPRSSYTIIVSAREQEKLPQPKSEEFFTLGTTIIKGGKLISLKKHASKFFKFRKEPKVHEQILKVVSDTPEEASSKQAPHHIKHADISYIPPQSQIISHSKNPRELKFFKFDQIYTIR